MRESCIPTSNRPDISVTTASISIEIAMQHAIRLDETLLADIVRRILLDHQVDAAVISIAVVDDPTMRQLNRKYLNHDYETDVLSFVLDRNLENGSLEGEIIVSAETAIRVAARLGIACGDELALYVIHGALHLVDCDDQDPANRRYMRMAESRYASQFGIRYSNPDGDESGADVIEVT